MMKKTKLVSFGVASVACFFLVSQANAQDDSATTQAAPSAEKKTGKIVPKLGELTYLPPKSVFLSNTSASYLSTKYKLEAGGVYCVSGAGLEVYMYDPNEPM